MIFKFIILKILHLGKVMKRLLLDSRKFPETDIDDIVHQLIHRGYGDDINPVTLIQKHMKGLPVEERREALFTSKHSSSI